MTKNNTSCELTSFQLMVAAQGIVDVARTGLVADFSSTQIILDAPSPLFLVWLCRLPE